MQYPLTFEQYQEGLRNGKFMGLKCQNCSTYTFPAQMVCSSCGGRDLNVAEMKGEGTIRSFTVVRVAPEGLEPHYTVAMVELDEGPWVTGNLFVQEPEETNMSLIGRKVRLGSQPFRVAPETEEDMHVLAFKLIV